MLRNTTVLVLDDENNYLYILEELLTEEGYTVHTCNDPALALLWIEKEQPDIVITDVKMPKISGQEVVKHIHSLFPDIPILIMTAFGSVENAVHFMKEGVFHYITKPFDNNELLLAVHGASELAFARKQYTTLYEHIASTALQDNIVAHSKAMQHVVHILNSITNTISPIILEGERGVGKKYLAKKIHSQSPHKKGLFLSITAEINDNAWLQKQLFGYTESRSTGTFSHKGLLEQAQGGTLFIEAIEYLDHSLQIELLQYLKQMETMANPPRIIVTVIKNIQELVQSGAIREDLYYYLNVVHIAIPALRERREDIPYLAVKIIKILAQKQEISVKTLTPEAISYLTCYEWFGNIDELHTVLERSLILTNGDTIDAQSLPAELQEDNTRFSSAVDLLPISLNLADTLEKIEEQLIRRALVHTNFVQARAAKLLGISKSRLQYKLMKYEISGHQLTY